MRKTHVLMEERLISHRARRVASKPLAHLIRDRDQIYGAVVTRRLRTMGI